MQARSDENNNIVSEINIIPFVDIVLVILIIFLIISPAIINPGFDINLPKAQTAKKPENVKALLSIDIDGVVYLNRKPLQEKELTRELKKFVAKDKNMKVVIAADGNVAHGNVISLIDLIRKAGVRRFAVSVESNK